jgi:hypothetical protein
VRRSFRYDFWLWIRQVDRGWGSIAWDAENLEEWFSQAYEHNGSIEPNPFSICEARRHDRGLGHHARSPDSDSEVVFTRVKVRELPSSYSAKPC